MTLVMALFQKQVNCPSDKAITMCGTTDRAMRLMPVRHNRIGTFAENKLRLAPTTMCRRTVGYLSLFLKSYNLIGIHIRLIIVTADMISYFVSVYKSKSTHPP